MKLGVWDIIIHCSAGLFSDLPVDYALTAERFYNIFLYRAWTGERARGAPHINDSLNFKQCLAVLLILVDYISPPLSRTHTIHTIPSSPHALDENNTGPYKGTFSLLINVPHYDHSTLHYSMLQRRRRRGPSLASSVSNRPQGGIYTPIYLY